MIEEHYQVTKSKKAKLILENWEEYRFKFKKVIPFGYKEILTKSKVESIKAPEKVGA